MRTCHQHLVSHTGPVPVTEYVTGPAVTFRAPVVEQIVSPVPQITKEIVEATQRVPSASASGVLIRASGVPSASTEHVALAPRVTYTAPEAERVATAPGVNPGVSCETPSPVTENVTSARAASNAAPCPVHEHVLPAPAGTYEVPLWYRQKRYAFVTRLERELSPASPFALRVEMARHARPRNSSVYRQIR